jgi:hypothetical protein
MTYFNRRFPLQPFTVTNPGTGGVNPHYTESTTQSYSGSATASVTFLATATGTTTRTGSATASVTFLATATGVQIEQGGLAYPGMQNAVGNIVGVSQSIIGLGMSAGSW